MYQSSAISLLMNYERILSLFMYSTGLEIASSGYALDELASFREEVD
jgi:hypothetical protein